MRDDHDHHLGGDADPQPLRDHRAWAPPAAPDSRWETPAGAHGAPPAGAHGAPPAGRVVVAPAPRKSGRAAAGVTIVVLLLASAGLGWLAWTNAQSATAWQQTAEQREQHLDGALHRLEEMTAALDATLADLEAVREDLRRSEADAAELEGRLTMLSSEKAAAEDQREVAREEAEVLAEVVAMSAEVGGRLDRCVDDLATWLVEEPALGASTSDWELWFSRGDRIATDCSIAQQQFAAFRRVVE